MRKIDTFIEEINKISNQLNLLEAEFLGCYKDFEGEEFDEQNKCAAEIENLVLMLTHELSSQIRFGVEDLKTLLKYIDFRKTFKDYSDEELNSIIDHYNELTITQRKGLSEGKEEQDIVKIISNWNKRFGNRSYNKVKEKLRLKSSYKI